MSRRTHLFTNRRKCLSIRPANVERPSHKNNRPLMHVLRWRVAAPGSRLQEGGAQRETGINASVISPQPAIRSPYAAPFEFCTLPAPATWGRHLPPETNRICGRVEHPCSTAAGQGWPALPTDRFAAVHHASMPPPWPGPRYGTKKPATHMAGRWVPVARVLKGKPIRPSFPS